MAAQNLLRMVERDVSLNSAELLTHASSVSTIVGSAHNLLLAWCWRGMPSPDGNVESAAPAPDIERGFTKHADSNNRAFPAHDQVPSLQNRVSGFRVLCLSLEFRTFTSSGSGF